MNNEEVELLAKELLRVSDAGEVWAEGLARFILNSNWLRLRDQSTFNRGWQYGATNRR